MFYDYVRNHPLVENNWDLLLAGEKIQSKSGYIYLIRRDVLADRVLVVRNFIEDTAYHAHSSKLVTTRAERSKKPMISTLESPQGRGKISLNRISDPDDRADFEGLRESLEVLMIEDRKKNSWISRAFHWCKEPAAKYFLLLLVAYAILTYIVL